MFKLTLAQATTESGQTYHRVFGQAENDVALAQEMAATAIDQGMEFACKPLIVASDSPLASYLWENYETLGATFTVPASNPELDPEDIEGGEPA